MNPVPTGLLTNDIAFILLRLVRCGCSGLTPTHWPLKTGSCLELVSRCELSIYQPIIDDFATAPSGLVLVDMQILLKCYVANGSLIRYLLNIKVRIILCFTVFIYIITFYM